MMKKNKNYLATIIFILTAVVLFQTSCNKDDDLQDGTADFSVSMESSKTVRSNYEAVNIDIQNVNIHISADTNETGCTTNFHYAA